MQFHSSAYRVRNSCRTAARFFLPLVRFAGLHSLSLGTPVGRKAAPEFKAHAAPLIRTKAGDLVADGAELVPRVSGVQDGLPVLADGSRAEVANVIWCTGFSGECPRMPRGCTSLAGISSTPQRPPR